MSGELRGLIREAERLGWVVQPHRTRHGAVVLYHPNGQTYQLPRLVGRSHRLKNYRAGLRRLARTPKGGSHAEPS